MRKFILMSCWPKDSECKHKLCLEKENNRLLKASGFSPCNSCQEFRGEKDAVLTEN